MNEKDFIPRWNLDSLYISLDSNEYKKDLKYLEEIFAQIKKELASPPDRFFHLA